MGKSWEASLISWLFIFVGKLSVIAKRLFALRKQKIYIELKQFSIEPTCYYANLCNLALRASVKVCVKLIPASSASCVKSPGIDVFFFTTDFLTCFLVSLRFDEIKVACPNSIKNCLVTSKCQCFV